MEAGGTAHSSVVELDSSFNIGALSKLSIADPDELSFSKVAPVTPQAKEKARRRGRPRKHNKQSNTARPDSVLLTGQHQSPRPFQDSSVAMNSKSYPRMQFSTCSLQQQQQKQQNRVNVKSSSSYANRPHALENDQRGQAEGTKDIHAHQRTEQQEHAQKTGGQPNPATDIRPSRLDHQLFHTSNANVSVRRQRTQHPGPTQDQAQQTCGAADPVYIEYTPFSLRGSAESNLYPAGVPNSSSAKTKLLSSGNIQRKTQSQPQSRSQPGQRRNQKMPVLNMLTKPHPSREYLDKHMQMGRALVSPRSLLIILDLNGTLVYRNTKRGIIRRPYLDEFLHYIFKHHYVMVWSSAMPDNVASMCGQIFDQQQQESLLAVWARDRLRLPPHVFKQRAQVYKRLSWIWEDRHINGSGLWDQTNTIMLDDSMEKAASEPSNLIQVEEFEARPDQMQSDVLGDVQLYLERLSYQANVSAYMRTRPFPSREAT